MFTTPTPSRPLQEEREGFASPPASAAAAPRPVTLAAQESINPIPKLLLSFPVPRLLSQTRLEAPWPSSDVDDDTPAGATNSGTSSTAQTWSADEVEGIVRGMQHSAQELLLTGSYTRFFQEQLHHETTPSETEMASGLSSATSAPLSALAHVRTAVAPGLRRLLASAGQQSAVLAASTRRSEPHVSSAPLPPGEAVSRQRVPLTRVPTTESWTRREDPSAMSLRPRAPLSTAAAAATGLGGAWATTSSESLDSAVGNAGGPAASSERRSGTRAAQSGGLFMSAVGCYEPRTGAVAAALGTISTTSAHTSDTSTPFAEWMRQHTSSSNSDVSVAALLQVIAALPLQLHPFKGIEADQLLALLSSLVSGTDEETTKDGEAALSAAARGLLCCQCLAHPHFPATAATPEGMVSRIIDVFARLVRDVATQLQDDDQQRSSAAFTSGGKSARGERSQAGAAGGPGMRGDAESLLPPLLEQLRGFLTAFAAILCNPHVRLANDSDLLRLEELCHHCLFRLTRASSKELHTVYSTYVTDSAVHLYRRVWNCLTAQRQSTAEHFMQHLPVCEALTQRTYQTHFDGRAVLPLTVSLLAAAQSTPLPAEAATAAAETLQWQCGLWANAFVHEFLLGAAAGERERTEDVLAWTTAIRVAEDLVDLLGVPEWPGADLLLRSLVMGLAHLTLSGEAASSPSAEALRPLAVDVLGHVAVRLFDAHRFPVSAAIAAEMERLGETASTSHDAARMALHHVLSAFPSSLHAEDRVVWQRLCGDAADATTTAAASTNTTEPEQQLHDLIAAVYLADSRLISDPTTAVDYADAWFHVRAARLLTWLCLHDATRPEWVPAAHLDAILRWKNPAGSGSGGHATNWRDVCAWTQAIATQSPRSMLSLHTRHTLVSMLFCVFHLKDAQGASVAVSDVVQKKTLAHLTRLTAAHPPLHHYLWPIVRQCVRDDSARVRESIVPLLLTLLNDAAEVEASGDAPAAGQMSPFAPDSIAAEVISSLLHLLGDKSLSVVSRTIAALDSFLTDPNYHFLLATPHGASLVSFVQQKLLLLVAGPTAEAKHRKEVIKHFVHRWVVTLADSVDSLSGAHAQLAKELVTLTIMSAPHFPFDVTPDHPLVQLLQGMHTHVVAYDPPSEGAVQGPAAAAVHPRRRPRGHHVDAAQLLHVMRCAAQSVWMRYQCFHSTDDAVASLATLRVLTLARSEWVVPLADVLAQSLAYPPPATSPLAGAPEALGGTLLQLCQVLHSILHTPKLPLLSLDYLSRCFTALLSKYVGPYQQRVIIASCGALCALITCGAKHRLSARVNVPYLRLCYALMNTYYCRVRALLPTLATQPQSIAYTQRFLFLLSEFLRMYPEWRQQPPHPALLDDAAISSATSSGGGGAAGTPNHLAKGGGIMANTYQLLEDVLLSCGDGPTRERVAVIALRVVASLCMLQPTTYFYRAEGQIRAALTSADASLQLQGLSLLSDFLKEEDERVDAASRNAARLDTTALILGNRASASTSRSRSRSGETGKEEKEEGKRHVKRGVKAMRRSTAAAAPAAAATDGRRAPKQSRTEAGDAAPLPKAAAAAAVGSSTASPTEDFNTGMSTWIFQKFHDDIARLATSSANTAVRCLCLRLFQQALQGGLLPPHKYVRTLIALAADVHAPLRQQAATSLAGLCDRHEEVVAAAVGRGVLLAFDLHHACGANLLRCAITSAPSALSGGTADRKCASATAAFSSGGELSAHGALYGLLHKRSRDNMVTTLVRVFYQDGKVAHWCDGHAEKLAVWASPLAAAAAVSSAAGPAGVFAVLHPILLLCHLTLVLFTLPFQHESDVLHLLQQCRVALDLNGQSALDWLREKESAESAMAVTGTAAAAPWKAVGSLLLAYLRRALIAEYRLTTPKVQRYRARESRGAHGAAPLRRRESVDGEGMTAQVLRWLQELVEALQPVLVATAGEEGVAARTTAWQFVASELEAALLSASAEDAGRGGGAAATAAAVSSASGRGRKAATGGKQRPAAASDATATTRRKRARSSSSEALSSLSCEDAEEAVDEELTSLSSSSATRSSASFVASQSDTSTVDTDEEEAEA